MHTHKKEKNKQPGPNNNNQFDMNKTLCVFGDIDKKIA